MCYCCCWSLSLQYHWKREDNPTTATAVTDALGRARLCYPIFSYTSGNKGPQDSVWPLCPPSSPVQLLCYGCQGVAVVDYPYPSPVRLCPPRRLSGRLLGDLTHVLFASVCFSPIGIPSMAPLTRNVSAHDNGSFCVHGLAPVRYAVFARLDGIFVGELKEVDLSNGDKEGLLLRLPVVVASRTVKVVGKCDSKTPLFCVPSRCKILCPAC